MPPKIRQVQIKNYKSIGQAVVDLGPFTALVGANGAGKSNFVDSLAFVAECLSSSIELAFKNRGGSAAVRGRSEGQRYRIGIRLVMDLEEAVADYSFEIAAKPKERIYISHERCHVSPREGISSCFEVKDGRFTREIPGLRPQVAPDRLALYAASATDEFRPVYDFLISMRSYSIEPTRLRELQDPDAGDVLEPDGSNAAAVLRRLEHESPDRYERICRLLGRIAVGIKYVRQKAVGQKETLRFNRNFLSRE